MRIRLLLYLSLTLIVTASILWPSARPHPVDRPEREVRSSFVTTEQLDRMFAYRSAKNGIYLDGGHSWPIFTSVDSTDALQSLSCALNSIGLKTHINHGPLLLKTGASFPFVATHGQSMYIVDRVDDDGEVTTIDLDGVKRIVDPQLLNSACDVDELVMERPDLHKPLALLQTVVPGEPALRWATCMVDAGEVSRTAGQTTFEFPFVNAGLGDLQIVKVIPSCGCVKVDSPRGPIHPQQGGKIIATYDVSYDRGPFTKSVAVQSNDKTAPSVRLVFGGYVIDRLVAGPLYVNFGRIRRGTVEQSMVVLRYYSRSDLRIVRTESGWSDLTVEYGPPTNDSVRAWWVGAAHKIEPDQLHNVILVKLTCRAGGIAKGPERTAVILHTNLAGSESTVRVTVDREVTEAG